MMNLCMVASLRCVSQPNEFRRAVDFVECEPLNNRCGSGSIDLLQRGGRCLEAISEVSTVKGVLPAEYGGVLGGQVNVLTRSGLVWRPFSTRAPASCFQQAGRHQIRPEISAVQRRL